MHAGGNGSDPPQRPPVPSCVCPLPPTAPRPQDAQMNEDSFCPGCHHCPSDEDIRLLAAALLGVLHSRAHAAEGCLGAFLSHLLHRCLKHFSPPIAAVRVATWCVKCCSVQKAPVNSPSQWAHSPLPQMKRPRQRSGEMTGVLQLVHGGSGRGPAWCQSPRSERPLHRACSWAHSPCGTHGLCELVPATPPSPTACLPQTRT